MCLLEFVIMVCVFPLETDNDWIGVERVGMMTTMELAVFAVLGRAVMLVVVTAAAEALVSVVADAADVD